MFFKSLTFYNLHPLVLGMPLVKQHNTWAQAAGKGLNNVGNGPLNCSSSDMENEQENSAGATNKVRMEENVNESQIAAAFSEGWGQRVSFIAHFIFVFH